MLKFRYLLLLAGLSLFLPTGCGESGSTWSGLKSMYYEYINTSPGIDLNATLEMPTGVMKLAPMMTAMDRHLEMLIQILVSQDSAPDPQVLEKILRDYPWLGGVAVIDSYGQVLIGSYAPVKEIDYQAVAAMSEDWADRSLHTQVQDNPLGPEICMAYPFFDASELRGLTVVHFDLRSLVGLSGYPEDLIIFTADHLLWSGDYGAQAEGLWRNPWEKMLKSDVYGEIKADGRNYCWMARYIGNLRLVYATYDDPDFVPSTDISAYMRSYEYEAEGSRPEDEVKTRALTEPMPMPGGRESFGPDIMSGPLAKPGGIEQERTIIVDDAQKKTVQQQVLHEEDITAEPEGQPASDH